jgi:hypothetical protein
MGKSIKPKDTWSGEDRFGRNENEATSTEKRVIGELEVRMKAKLKNARKMEWIMKKLHSTARKINWEFERQIRLIDLISRYAPIDIDLKMKKNMRKTLRNTKT